MNDVLVSRREQSETREMIALVTEHKIQMFREKLSTTPKCYSLHKSIEKLIAVNEERLAKLKGNA